MRETSGAIGRFILAWLLWCVASFPALAHDPKLASIQVVCQPSTTTIGVVVHRALLAADSGATIDAALESAIRGRLRLQFDGSLWTPTRGKLQLDEANDLLTWQGTVPRAVKEVRLLSALITKDPGAFTVLQVFQDGQRVDEQLLDANSPSLQQPQAPSANVVRFFEEGLRHIAGGFDHLAFVLGLVLVSRRTRRAFLASTGFTVAHSMTLAATALGWIAPNSNVVEALVAGSIALVAGEALWGGHGGGRRIGIHALGFGLIHGMAFASAIKELMSGTVSIGAALIGFNAGVEFGQGLFVLATAPLLGWLASRRPKAHQKLHSALASCVGLAGLWWLGARLAELSAS